MRLGKKVKFSGFVLVFIIILKFTFYGSTSNKIASDLTRLGEIQADSFGKECRNSETDTCIGKFIVWKAKINKDVGLGAYEIDVDTVDGHGTLNLISPTREGFIEGEEILFHARISELNTLSANVYNDAYVRKVLVSSSEVQIKNKKRDQAKEQKIMAEMVVGAQMMNVSVEEYRVGYSAEAAAHIDCQIATKNSAKWNGASVDWTPNYSWSIKNHVISIHGRDVTMKNGFGGSRDIDYTCQYGLSSKEAVVVSVD